MSHSICFNTWYIIKKKCMIFENKNILFKNNNIHLKKEVNHIYIMYVTHLS